MVLFAPDFPVTTQLRAGDENACDCFPMQGKQGRLVYGIDSSFPVEAQKRSKAGTKRTTFLGGRSSKVN